MNNGPVTAPRPVLAPRTFSRRPTIRRADTPEQARIRVTFIGLVLFFAGLGAAWKLNVIGEVYVAELALLVLAIIAIPAGFPKLRGNRAFMLVVASAILTMIGYVVSDLVRGTSEAQYLRGWARNAMVIVSAIVLSAFVAKDKRNIWWFIAGLSLGSILWFEVVQRLPLRSPEAWKFNYAVNVSLLLACTAAFLPRKVVAVLFMLLGVYSVTMDFRIHGALCVVVGTLLWATGTVDPRKAMVTMVKLGMILLVGMVAAVTLVNMTKNDYTDQRRTSSNVGRLLGIHVGLAAIANSPIVGYGSWPTDPELVRISRQVTREYEAETGRSTGGEVFLNAHSQILNAWLEGGVLGAAFYMVVFGFLLWGCYWGLVKRPPDLFTPLIALLFFSQLWNLLMSPLGSAGRLLFACSVALVVLIASERLAGKVGRRR